MNQISPCLSLRAGCFKLKAMKENDLKEVIKMIHEN